MALLRYSAEGRSILVDPTRPDEPIPRTSILCYPSSTIQMARRALPRLVLETQGPSLGRQVPAVGWNLGGNGCEYAIWRITL